MLTVYRGDRCHPIASYRLIQDHTIIGEVDGARAFNRPRDLFYSSSKIMPRVTGTTAVRLLVAGRWPSKFLVPSHRLHRWAEPTVAHRSPDRLCAPRYRYCGGPDSSSYNLPPVPVCGKIRLVAVVAARLYLARSVTRKYVILWYSWLSAIIIQNWRAYSENVFKWNTSMHNLFYHSFFWKNQSFLNINTFDMP